MTKRCGCLSPAATITAAERKMPTCFNMTGSFRFLSGQAGVRELETDDTSDDEPNAEKSCGIRRFPNSTIPRITVPTAPTPTQTLYAVPTGRDFIAMPSNQRLMIIATVQTVGKDQ